MLPPQSDRLPCGICLTLVCSADVIEHGGHFPGQGRRGCPKRAVAALLKPRVELPTPQLRSQKLGAVTELRGGEFLGSSLLGASRCP
jgi:hypothetical protein